MENQTFYQQSPEEQPAKRSKFLTRICYLSFIGSGFAILAGLLYTFFLDDVITLLVQNPSEMNDLMVETLSDLNKNYFAMEAILSSASLAGVIYMWKLKKIGFHIYTMANILILGLPLFFGVGTFGFENFFLITGPFIGLYALNLKQMQ